MLAFSLRLIRLPIDLVFLVWDFVRITAWLAMWPVWKMLGRSHHRRGPCDRSRCGSVEVDGTRMQLCPPAQKYGSPSLLRLLCRWLESPDLPSDKSTVFVCARRGPFRVSAPRYIFVALLLGTVATAGVKAAKVAKTTFFAPSPTASAAAQPRRLPSRPGTKAEDFIRKAKQLAKDGHVAEARIEYKNAVQLDPADIDAQMALAHCCLELGRADEARRAFEAAAELDPARANALVGIIGIVREQGDFERAVRHAHTVCELRPDDPRARLQLSDCLRLAGDPENARKAAETAIALDPADPEGLVAIARIELERERLAEAEDHCLKALAISPESVDARLVLADVALARGRQEEAIRHYREVLAHEPDNVPAALALAECHLAGGDWETAIALHRRVVAQYPGRRDTRQRLASLLLEAGHTDEGYSVAQALIVENPKDPVTHLILADAFLDKGFAGLAVEHCRRAMANDAASGHTHRLLARAYMEGGDADSAVAELERLSRTFPNDLDTQISLALCYDAMGSTTRAIQYLQEAGKTHAASPLPYVHLGQLYRQRGNVEPAIASYRTALERDPDNAVALNNLAALLLDHHGNVATARDEAFELATRAWRLLPENPMIADTLGWAQFHRKDYTRAVNLLGYAVRKLPREPEVRYHLGAVLHAQGRLAEARRQLELALSISSDFGEAERAKVLITDIRSRSRETREDG